MASTGTQILVNCIVSVFASSVEDIAFEPVRLKPKNIKLVFVAFPLKHASLKRKSIDWQAQNQDNVYLCVDLVQNRHCLIEMYLVLAIVGNRFGVIAFVDFKKSMCIVAATKSNIFSSQFISSQFSIFIFIYVYFRNIDEHVHF